MPEGQPPEALIDLDGEEPPADGFFTEERIARLLDLFDVDLEFEVRMSIARRCHLPFSEVAERWTLNDLAMELAWDRRLMLDHIERCPDCGVKPSEQLKPGGRVMGTHTAWRIEVKHCLWCEERDEVEARETQTPLRKRPPRIVYVPRFPGESFYEPPLAPGSDEDEEPAASEAG